MKYKCKDCEHVFDSDQTVFECPQCGGTNIVEDGNFCTRNKKLCRILAAVITVLILLLLIPDCKGTKVDVDDSKKGKIVVSLKGEKVNEFNIIVTRNGVALPAKRYKDKPVNFSFDVPGEYRLQVRYVGKGKMPEISTYTKGPWIIEPPKPGDEPIGIQTPQILEVKIENTNTKLNTYSIKVITDTKAVPLSDTEFSIDNANYQSSDIFNLKPGFYTFYAKNIINDSTRTFQRNLPDIVDITPPTDVELNQFLIEIANGDAKHKKWIKAVEGPPAIKVAGVAFIADTHELAHDAYAQGTI